MKILFCILLLLSLTSCGKNQGSLPNLGIEEPPAESTELPNADDLLEEDPLYESPDRLPVDESPNLEDEDKTGDGDNETDSIPESDSSTSPPLVNTTVEDNIPDTVYRDVTADEKNQKTFLKYIQGFFKRYDRDGETMKDKLSKDYPGLEVKPSIWQHLGTAVESLIEVQTVTIHPIEITEEHIVYFAEISCEQTVYVGGNPFTSTHDYVSECTFSPDGKLTACVLYATDTSIAVNNFTDSEGDDSPDSNAEDDIFDGSLQEPSAEDTPTTPNTPNPPSGGLEMLDPSDPDYVPYD